jgi:hypothetical protein
MFKLSLFCPRIYVGHMTKQLKGQVAIPPPMSPSFCTPSTPVCYNIEHQSSGVINDNKFSVPGKQHQQKGLISPIDPSGRCLGRASVGSLLAQDAFRTRKMPRNSLRRNQMKMRIGATTQIAVTCSPNQAMGTRNQSMAQFLTLIGIADTSLFCPRI